MNKFIVDEKMEQKFVVCEKMESNDPEMTIVGWGSKPTIDRDKELIESSAWNLDNYRKNPVLLLCHQYNVPAIGKCLWVKAIPGQGLRFKAQFAKTDRGREVYELYSSGIMSAFSVGFKPRPNGVIDNPTDVKYKGCKKVFTDVELMEISCVPVPAHSDALIEHVKAGKIHTKQLKAELEAIIEIIEKSDDTLEIEVKATDPSTATEIKIEVTEDFVHVPAPGEEGKHKDCKIRTIPISKKDGIQGKYCIDDKTVIGYMFAKDKDWDKDKAVKWVEDHKKELVFDVPESETESINIKSEDAAWDTDGDIAFIDTKSVTPEKDEAEKDFMTRCMGDKSMAKLNEGFRTNACKLMWKKNQSKESVVEETKAMKPMMDEKMDVFMTRCMADKTMMASNADEKDRTGACQVMWDKMHPAKKDEEEIINKEIIPANVTETPSIQKITSAIETVLNKDYKSSEPQSEKNCNYWVSNIFPTGYPATGFAIASRYCGMGTNKSIKVDYEFDIKTGIAMLTNMVEVDQVYESKKESEPDAVITKQESVDEFLTRILPERILNIKTAEELAQVFEKASGYDDMKETVGAMESQIGAMEPIAVFADQIGKSADAEGNPSLYDLTGAVDRALNPMRNPDRSIPSSINEKINPPYRAVIDIFAVNYPSGHVVYSEYDRVAGQSKYFQIGYEYDLKMRVVTIIGEPEEVLQSWVTERYMIEKDTDVEYKDEQEIETKIGKVLSAKNKKVLTDCMDQMMSAHAAMEEMMTMAEGLTGESKDEQEVVKKDDVSAEEKDEFEIIEKEEEHIEFDLEAPVEKVDDGMIEITDDVIKNAISSAIKDNPFKIDMKSAAAEVVARLTGRATLSK